MSREPDEVDADGSATWDLDPFEITTDAGAGTVAIDGRSTSPQNALAVADALRDAAMRVMREGLNLDFDYEKGLRP